MFQNALCIYIIDFRCIKKTIYILYVLGISYSTEIVTIHWVKSAFEELSKTQLCENS